MSSDYYSAHQRAVFVFLFLPAHLALCANPNQTFISNMSKLMLCRLSWVGTSSAQLHEVRWAKLSPELYDRCKPSTLQFPYSSGECRV